MYAVGVCWKRKGWIFSVYKCVGDAYPTLRVRRVKCESGKVLRANAVKTPFGEVFEVVRRLGKT